VSNLAVSIAFMRQEMKHLIASGADTTRTYTGDQPTEAFPAATA